MPITKVKNKEGILGYVAVENWANPKTYLMDFQMENGDIKVEERDNLEYIGIEEI